MQVYCLLPAGAALSSLQHLYLIRAGTHLGHAGRLPAPASWGGPQWPTQWWCPSGQPRQHLPWRLGGGGSLPVVRPQDLMLLAEMVLLPPWMGKAGHARSARWLCLGRQ